MADFIFHSTVNNMLFSLALALIAAAVGIKLKRSAIAHILWLLVLLKLLTPPFVSIPGVSIPNLTDTEGRTAPDAKIRTVLQDPLAVPPVDTGATDYLPPADRSVSSVDFQGWLLPAWLFASGIVLAASLFQILRFHRLLLRKSTAAAPEIQSLAAAIASRLGMRKAPPVSTTPANLSPMVWWIGAEIRIVLPDSLIRQMDSRQLGWILAHELAHVRRRDYWVRWIEWLVCVCFWWNPVAWWARRNLRAHEELCCDALVLSALRPEPEKYGASLLRAVEILTFPAHYTSIVASGINGGKLLKNRVRRIIFHNVDGSNLRRHQAGLFLGALIVLPLGLMIAKDNPDGLLPVPFVKENACPFEGCTYGTWNVLKETAVYAKPDTGSKVSGRLKQGETVRAHKGFVSVIPGRAKATDRSNFPAGILDPEKEIFILDYIGEGYSRVFQDGRYLSVKIARTRDQCRENPQPKYCWAEVIEEPVVTWWVSVESGDGKIKGWVCMDDGALEPIDKLAFRQNPAKAFIVDPDGYTNVREKPTVQSDIIYRLKEGEEFTCYPEQNSSWWKIITDTRLFGYVHKSRIKV